jgi:hypothetical protein
LVVPGQPFELTSPSTRWRGGSDRPVVLVGGYFPLNGRQVQVLEFLVNREERHPGGSLQGSTLPIDAATLEPDRSLAYNNVTRAVPELKRLGWIEWVYPSWPSGPVEPSPHLITEQDVRRAARRPRGPKSTSSTRLLASSPSASSHKIDLFLILAGADKKLDVLAEDKEEARSVLRRMREAGTTTLTATAATVLADAVRNALGLP